MSKLRLFTIFLILLSCSKRDDKVISFENYSITSAQFKHMMKKKFNNAVISEAEKKNFIEKDIISILAKLAIIDANKKFVFDSIKYIEAQREMLNHKLLYKKLVNEKIHSDEYLKSILNYLNTNVEINMIVLKNETENRSIGQTELLADSLLSILMSDLSKWEKIVNEYSDDDENRNKPVIIEWGKADYALQKSIYNNAKGLIPFIVRTLKGFLIINIIGKHKNDNNINDLSELRSYFKSKGDKFYSIESNNYSKYLKHEYKIKYPIKYFNDNIQYFLMEFEEIKSKTLTHITFSNNLLAESDLGKIFPRDIDNKLFVNNSYYATKYDAMNGFDVKTNFIDKIYTTALLNKMCVDNNIKISDNELTSFINNDLIVYKIYEYENYLAENIQITEDEIKVIYEQKKKTEHIGSYASMKTIIVSELKSRKAKNDFEIESQKFMHENKKSFIINYNLL